MRERRSAVGGGWRREEGEKGSGYLDLQKVFWRSVDLFEGLLTGVGHGLHLGS